MRVDARRNREQIVVAARELVAREGDAVRMDALAERAGVAVGTLYRHFPTKADLVGAMVGEATRDLAVRAEVARERVRRGASARHELDVLIAPLPAGHGAREAWRLVAAHDASGSAARAVMALDALVAAARDAGEFRADVDLDDLLLLLVRAPDEDRTNRERYLDLVTDGLRPR
ncbi:helix-turn-helix domain-containing protein [Actinomycetospora termitidis]|uniref:Helix-turn-helix domain-containing protein n=1 Tax=Actinomycetospora termitidis TaxID=3053470 RepID=A0ABT7MGN8_9PSEU|nr:helix-turn-helix domain-containing protein [Actinomycetospora sp. Odt1-22]MDL5159848.1 helix-turn-helix domain-containing protein [Actinomycetospora sp. Odt1-22]